MKALDRQIENLSHLKSAPNQSMLPNQTIEELISISYVSAIIARSGFTPNSVSKDYGVDLEVRSISKHGDKYIDLGPFLEFQLKASVNWSTDSTHVVFDLDADAYNRLVLRRKNAILPCALVVCCLPEDKATWLNVNEDGLTLRKSCYYYFISGSETKNTSSQRIRIPRNQLLTPESLLNLQQKLREEVRK